MPEAESLQESRMREIRTSGLTRGRASKPSLLYWQGPYRGVGFGRSGSDG